MFERVKEGPNAGQLVRLECNGPAVRKTNPPINRSVSGYGSRIPTQWMVRTIDQRWRRVYCAIYSNIGTLYVRHGKDKTIVDIGT